MTEAITLSQVRSNWSAIDEEEFENWKKKINRFLSDMITDSTAVTVGTREISVRMRNKIAEAYRSAGWSVHLKSDPRDGDYLEFSME